MSHSSPSSLHISTTNGPILGFSDSYPLLSKSSALDPPPASTPRRRTPIHKWLGIPYASAGRFERPSPPRPWTETKKCWEWGSMFPQDLQRATRQMMDKKGLGRGWIGQSEEGHNVNVFKVMPEAESADRSSAKPGSGEGKLLPVMVWVYGGGLEYGSSEEVMYDPTTTMRRGWEERGESFLFVSGNYRTNIFGFFSGPDVKECDEENLSGNYGLYDVVAMFEWVRANARQFGGDPDNVTAFGESAGAIAISQLFCSGKRLFNKAILQSAGPMTKDTRKVGAAYRPYKQIMKQFAGDAKTAAKRMEALRAVPAADLLAAHLAAGGSQPSSMTLEAGTEGVLSESVQLRLERGDWDPWIEAVIAGTCEDEGTFFVWQDPEANSTAGISKLLKRYPPMVAARARVLWPDNPTPKDLTKAPMALFSADWTFNVPVLQLAKAMSGKNSKSGEPCKLWLFRYRQPVGKMMGSKINFGITHTMDLPATFNVEQFWNAGDGNAGTARVMNSLWAAFAKSGTPGTDWTPFTPSTPSWLVFNPGGHIQNERIESFDHERSRFLAELLLEREPRADPHDGSSSGEKSML